MRRGIAVSVRRSWFLLVVAVLFAACTPRPGADHYAAVLDELSVPSGWELVHTTVREPGGAEWQCDLVINPDCPSVHRFYLTNTPAADAYHAAIAMATDAGFIVKNETRPTCTSKLPWSPQCLFFATKAYNELAVNVFNPGDDPYNLGIADPSRILVELRANKKQ